MENESHKPHSAQHFFLPFPNSMWREGFRASVTPLWHESCHVRVIHFHQAFHFVQCSLCAWSLLSDLQMYLHWPVWLYCASIAVIPFISFQLAGTRSTGIGPRRPCIPTAIWEPSFYRRSGDQCIQWTQDRKLWGTVYLWLSPSILQKLEKWGDGIKLMTSNYWPKEFLNISPWRGS